MPPPIMKNILNKILTGLKYVVLTNLGRIITLMLLAPLFDYLSQNASNDTVGQVFYIAFLVCVGALLLYTLVFIVFAWIINPIRDYRENKKIREEWKNKNK